MDNYVAYFTLAGTWEVRVHETSTAFEPFGSPFAKDMKEDDAKRVAALLNASEAEKAHWDEVHAAEVAMAERAGRS